MSNFINDIKFSELYSKQMNNQTNMLNLGLYEEFISIEDTIKTLPFDNIKLSSYHIQQLMSEVGELLDADKRWKNFRNGKYDGEQKLEELSDCFIVLMNIGMFSGFTASEITDKIQEKLNIVSARVQEEAMYGYDKES